LPVTTAIWTKISSLDAKLETRVRKLDSSKANGAHQVKQPEKAKVSNFFAECSWASLNQTVLFQRSLQGNWTL
jgi:hypothetical protein